MKTQEEIKKLEQEVALANETDKVFLVLVAIIIFLLAVFVIVIWSLFYHTVSTVITIGLLFLLVKLLSK
jgi:hypothetical protein